MIPTEGHMIPTEGHMITHRGSHDQSTDLRGWLFSLHIRMVASCPQEANNLSLGAASRVVMVSVWLCSDCPVKEAVVCVCVSV